jgi:hypothetical protein
MEADDLLCSRNARSRTPLVGRAQWKINQPPFLKREQASLEASFGRIWVAHACGIQSPYLPSLQCNRPIGSIALARNLNVLE